MKDLQFYLNDCNKNGYCIGAYNFFNIETLRGICEGCKKSHSPAILSVSEGALSYMGENLVKPLFDAVKKEYKLPIFLHLDHGKSYEMCKKAIELGFDSVMIDGSALSFDDNVKLTKKVVNYAHSKNVLVEAELGVLAGVEETGKKVQRHIFTDPASTREFVEKTHCDSLAIAIGTSHGAYKFKGPQEIRFDILKEIEKEIPETPLVLHGASSIPQQYVATINRYGGQILGAVGVPERFLRKTCTKHNIYKINCDTDIRLAYNSTLRKNFVENPKNLDIRKANTIAIAEISNMVARKNKKIFNNFNRI